MFGRKPPPAPLPLPPLSGNLLVFGLQGWLVAFAVLSVLHAACFVLARRASGVLEPLRKDAQLAAHFLPQLLAFAITVWYGAADWILTMREPASPAAAAAAYVPQGDRLACFMFGFQLYELAACVPCRRLRGGVNELVGHHVISLLLSGLIYHRQAFQYYAPCYMGMAEISSVPLAFVDLFKHFPPLRARFPAFNAAVRNVFVLTFLIFRAVYWPYCSIGFFRNALAVLASELVVPSVGVVYTFMVCNVLMTLLQWYWTSIILVAVVRMVNGDPRHKEA